MPLERSLEKARCLSNPVSQSRLMHTTYSKSREEEVYEEKETFKMKLHVTFE
jgi:hypothetical protein